MTNKQKNLFYYKIQGYSARQCSLICGVSDSYARKILNATWYEDLDLTNYQPEMDCIVRRKVLDHIISGIGYVFVPKNQKYAYISLLGYLGLCFKDIRNIYPEDESAFIYMALHRSNKA